MVEFSLRIDLNVEVIVDFVLFRYDIIFRINIVKNYFIVGIGCMGVIFFLGVLIFSNFFCVCKEKGFLVCKNCNTLCK